MAENRTFTLIASFRDGVTPELKKIQKQIQSLTKDVNKFSKESKEAFEPLAKFLKKDTKLVSEFAETLKEAEKIAKSLKKATSDIGTGVSGKSISKLTEALDEAGRSAGKVRDTVSQIGENVKGLDGIAESLNEAGRAAVRAQGGVEGIGESAGRANKKVDSLMTTLLKAEGLSRLGDVIPQGFSRGMSGLVGTAKKGGGFIGKAFRESMEDELADVKAASGIQGSFELAGYKGSFVEAQKMYKKYDQVVSEMIRQSSAPTAKVVELQRYTLDTMGPLMLAAEGVAKGTAVKDIDPRKIESSAKQYGSFLEKVALFSQGTGSAGFRVASGIEGLVTRGKIDTQLDFFTDNIMLMKNLENAGFAGRGMRSAKMMTATDAERMKAMLEAFNKSMSGEATAAMAQSLTGSLQGIQDTIFNPSVGILGMSVTFSKEEQKKANEAIRKIQNQRINQYQTELRNTQKGTERYEQLQNNIKQAEITRDKLISEDIISTPFKAFSYAFTGLIQGLTNALNAIGPVWTQFAVGAIEVTNRVFGPLAENLNNIASEMRGKEITQAQGFGRIVGEIFKSFGKVMADLAMMVSDPTGALGKTQSEFMSGFMSAFKGGELEKAKKGMADGILAIVSKAFEFLGKVITWEPVRPLVLAWLTAIFGPPLATAVISALVPLFVSWVGGVLASLLSGIGAAKAGAAAASGAATLIGAGEGIAGAAGVFGSIGAGLASLAAVVASFVAVAAIFVIFQGPLLAFGSALQGFGQSLQTSSNWLVSASGQLIQGLGQLISGFTNFFAGLWDIISGLLMGDSQKVVAGIKRVFSGVASIFVGIGRSVGGLGGIVIGAIGNLFRTIADLLRIAASKVPGLGFLATSAVPTSRATAKPTQTTPRPYVQTAPRKQPNVNPYGSSTGKKRSAAFGSPGVEFGSLGSAINYEMKNKPPGSDLVIANSSETIIPATGGLNNGTEGIINAIFTTSQRTAAVFSNSINSSNQRTSTAISSSSQRTASVIVSSSQKTSAVIAKGLSNVGSKIAMGHSQTVSAINRSIATSSAENRAIMAAVRAASAAGGFGGGRGEPGAGLDGGMSGGGLGGGGGSLSAATSLAGSMGLITTSGYRPGDPGWHGVNRARDYSNGTGPTPQMLSFARTMAGRYGASMKELIYTPLGFGIKNGRKVAPYARAAHYNHVHVAFAQGLGNGRYFPDSDQAIAYEKAMAPAGAKVSTVTANSSEGGFGTTTVNAPITINGYNRDPEELASLVAMKISQAVESRRRSSGTF